MNFTEGLYNLKERSFVVDRDAQKRLEEYRAANVAKHVDFVLDREIDSVRSMTSSEVRKLLGGGS